MTNGKSIILTKICSLKSTIFHYLRGKNNGAIHGSRNGDPPHRRLYNSGDVGSRDGLLDLVSQNRNGCPDPWNVGSFWDSRISLRGNVPGAPGRVCSMEHAPEDTKT